jgi:hypothetical protein
MARFLAGVMKFRLLILAAAIGVLALGIVQLRGNSMEVLPEFSPPYAEIHTEALGLSADEVEQLITVPLEQDLLNGVEGVDVIRSESLPGLSSIVMVFEPRTDIYRARQLIEERLSQAHGGALPQVSKPSTLLQPLSSANRVLMIGMSTTELTPIEQSVIARWTVRPRLMGVPGVANVSIWGLRDQQLQVQVDPQVLRDHNVTLNQVISTAGNAQVVSPLSFLEASTPGTGGFIETPQQRLQVRHLLEKLTDPAEVAKVPVEGAPGNLTLGDVAQIKVDHQPLIGDVPWGQHCRGPQGRPGCPCGASPWAHGDQHRHFVVRTIRLRHSGRRQSRARDRTQCRTVASHAARTAIPLACGARRRDHRALVSDQRRSGTQSPRLWAQCIGRCRYCSCRRNRGGRGGCTTRCGAAPTAGSGRQPGCRTGLGRHPAGSGNSASAADLCRHYHAAGDSSGGRARGPARSIL